MKTSAEIIVIGAGIAGLTAAKLLHDSGFDVIVLEAQKRIGGRTQTLELPNGKIDAGAMWIHYYRGNPLTYIAEAYGWEIQEDVFDPFQIWDAEQRRKLGRKRFKYLDEAEAAYEAGSTYFFAHMDVSNTADFLEKYLSEQQWSKKKERMVRFLYRAFVELDYGANMEQVSFADNTWLNTFDNDSDDYALLQNGYGQLVALLQNDLDPYLSTEVQAIDYSDIIIKIETSKGVFRCQNVIVTIPLGVLKKNSTQFTPSLPIPKQEAIAKLGFGRFEKVILTFKTVFWNEQKEYFYFKLCEHGLVFPSITDFSAQTGEPTLVLFYAARYAEYLQTQSDEFIFNAALNVLQEIFPEADIEVVQHHITHWSKDVHFGGSYSYSNSFENEGHIDALAQPIKNRLFFAGEATSKIGQGYVHGALLSGISVAQQLGASTEHIMGLDDYFARDISSETKIS